MCAHAHLTAAVHGHTFSRTITKSFIDLAKFSQHSKFQNFHRTCSSASQKKDVNARKHVAGGNLIFLCLLIHAKRKEKRKIRQHSKNKSHHLAWQHRLKESSGLINSTCNRTQTPTIKPSYMRTELRATC